MTPIGIISSPPPLPHPQFLLRLPLSLLGPPTLAFLHSLLFAHLHGLRPLPGTLTLSFCLFGSTHPWDLNSVVTSLGSPLSDLPNYVKLHPHPSQALVALYSVSNLLEWLFYKCLYPSLVSVWVHRPCLLLVIILSQHPAPDGDLINI